MAKICAKCSKQLDEKKGFLGGKTRIPSEEIDGKLYCNVCARDVLWEKINQVVLTTSNNIDNYEATRYLGIVSCEVVVGTGFWSEVTADWADLWGTRASGFEKKLANGKDVALAKLQSLAYQRGANAVIGIDLDYMNTIKNQLVIVANGTAVKLEKKG